MAKYELAEDGFNETLSLVNKRVNEGSFNSLIDESNSLSNQITKMVMNPNTNGLKLFLQRCNKEYYPKKNCDA